MDANNVPEYDALAKSYSTALSRYDTIKTMGIEIIGRLVQIFQKVNITVNDNFEFLLFNVEYVLHIEVIPGEGIRKGFIVAYHKTINDYGKVVLTKVDEFWFDHLGNTEFDEYIYSFFLGSLIKYTIQNRIMLK